MDSFAGLVFFLLTGCWFQQKTYHQLSFERDYKSYFPVAASRKNSDGSDTATPVNRLEPGDIIVVRNGELIPADGILLRGTARVDYSFVTGEADPVAVSSGARIYAGGKQNGETIEISLTRRVNTSYLTQLWNDEAFKSKAKGHVSLLADRAGRYFTAVILGVAGLSLVLGAVRFEQSRECLYRRTHYCLPLRRGPVYSVHHGKRPAYSGAKPVLCQKHQRVGGIFGGAGRWCSIKPGRLRIYLKNVVQFFGKRLSGADQVALKSLAYQSSHPLSRQIVESMPEVPLETVENFVEQPGQGISGRVAGSTVRLGSAAFISANQPGQKGVFAEKDGEVCGYFDIKSRFREGLPEVLSYFNSQNAGATLLSGDNNREQDALTAYFKAPGTLFFNQSPQDKLDLLVKKHNKRAARCLCWATGSTMQAHCGKAT